MGKLGREKRGRELCDRNTAAASIGAISDRVGYERVGENAFGSKRYRLDSFYRTVVLARFGELGFAGREHIRGSNDSDKSERPQAIAYHVPAPQRIKFDITFRKHDGGTWELYANVVSRFDSGVCVDRSREVRLTFFTAPFSGRLILERLSGPIECASDSLASSRDLRPERPRDESHLSGRMSDNRANRSAQGARRYRDPSTRRYTS